MPWDKVKKDDILIDKTPEQIEREKVIKDISILENKKKNIQDEINNSLRSAFKAKDEELSLREKNIIECEKVISSKYADAQFIINKNNSELAKIKEDYAKKYKELDTKINENDELRNRLLSLIKENEDNQKVIAEKNAKIEEIGLNIAENNRKLAEQLAYAQKGNEYIDGLKNSLKEDRELLDLAILRNNNKEFAIEERYKDIDVQYDLLDAERKSLEKSKLDFTNESESVGHEIKKQQENLKISMNAIKSKEDELNSRQLDIDDKSRFLTLRERQIDEKIKILKELRSKGDN